MRSLVGGGMALFLAAASCGGAESEGAQPHGAAGAGAGGSAGTATGSGGGEGTVCEQGQTRACVGVGACEGGQSCGVDGLWGECLCASGAAGSSTSGGAPSGGSGNGGTAGDASSGAGGTGGQGGANPACLDAVGMFILLDRSGSMVGFGAQNGNLWIPVGTALGEFVVSAASTGVSAGIGFFPEVTDTDECDLAAYTAPTVPIAPLPDNGAAIQTAIVDYGPTAGRTPTLPAVDGALQYLTGWAATHPASKAVLVLATDGEPNVCSSTIDAVSQMVAAALTAAPSIQTHVIGIGNVAGLDQIAQAGGTGSALIVDADPVVAAEQFSDAMTTIRDAASGPGCP